MEEECIGEDLATPLEKLKAESMLEMELTGEDGLSRPGIIDLSGQEVLISNWRLEV